MSIYLDTNILPQPPSGPATVSLGVLRALAEQSSQALILPSLVVDESVSARRRHAEELVADIRSHSRELGALSGTNIHLDELPNPDDVAHSWRASLEDRFEMIPTTADDAAEALRREVYRIRPCREGMGARDAAIWLTICRHHSTSDEAGFFVSNNRKDFAGSDGRSLHSDLAADVTNDRRPLSYCRDAADVVRTLASASDRQIGLGELSENENVRLAVVRAVELVARGSELGFSDAGSAIGRVYIAGEIEVRFYQVWGQESFTVQDLTVSVFETRCSWGAVVGVLKRHAGGGLAEVAVPAMGEMNLQLMATTTDGKISGADILEISSSRVDGTYGYVS